MPKPPASLVRHLTQTVCQRLCGDAPGDQPLPVPHHPPLDALLEKGAPEEHEVRLVPAPAVILQPGHHVLAGVPAAEVDLVPAHVELLDPKHPEHFSEDGLEDVKHTRLGGVELATGGLDTPVLPRFLQ